MHVYQYISMIQPRLVDSGKGSRSPLRFVAASREGIEGTGPGGAVCCPRGPREGVAGHRVERPGILKTGQEKYSAYEVEQLDSITATARIPLNRS